MGIPTRGAKKNAILFMQCRNFVASQEALLDTDVCVASKWFNSRLEQCSITNKTKFHIAEACALCEQLNGFHIYVVPIFARCKRTDAQDFFALFDRLLNKGEHLRINRIVYDGVRL